MPRQNGTENRTLHDSHLAAIEDFSCDWWIPDAHHTSTLSRAHVEFTIFDIMSNDPEVQRTAQVDRRHDVGYVKNTAILKL